MHNIYQEYDFNPAVRSSVYTCVIRRYLIAYGMFFKRLMCRSVAV